MNNPQVSFPGFGIRPFEVDPDFLTIGDFAIKWYAVIIVFGMLTAAAYVFLQSRKGGLILDDLIDLFLFIVFPAVIGTRLYYVIFNPSTVNSFWDIFNFRDGGLAIYGGIITGGIMAIVTLRYKKMRIFTFLDLLAPAVMIAQAIGRWGNFMNVEAYGTKTDLPWRMGIIRGSSEIFVHPTFLYESLWNLVGFLFILFFLHKKKKYDGQVTLFYFGWYGLGRMMIEGLRTDSLYIGDTGIRVSQLLAAILMILSFAALIYFQIRIKGRKVSPTLYHENAKNYEASLKAIEDYEKKCADRKAAREEKKKAKQNS